MCISGAPADGTNFHVSFLPGPRLTARGYKDFLAGSPADGSLRVKMKIACLGCFFFKLGPSLVRTSDPGIIQIVCVH